MRKSLIELTFQSGSKRHFSLAIFAFAIVANHCFQRFHTKIARFAWNFSLSFTGQFLGADEIHLICFRREDLNLNAGNWLP